MVYCKEIDYLPTIPSHLIKDLKTIETYTDLFLRRTDKHVGVYSSYEANKDLTDYIQQLFDYPIRVRYQVIKKTLPVHVDKANVPKKLNYIIDTGGDVKTRWWSNVDDPKQIIAEHQQKANTWYELDIHTPHDITIPDRPRVSVTVRRPN